MIWRLLERMFTFLPKSKFRRWAVLVLHFESLRKLQELYGSGLQVREILLEELDSLSGINPEILAHTLGSRFDSGNQCFVSTLGVQPVFYQWLFVNDSANPVHANRHTDMYVDLLIPPRWGYLWDLWTRTKYRGQGIQPMSTRIMCDELRADGLEGIVALVNVNNHRSLRAMAKSGFIRRADLTHVRCLGRDLVCGKYSVKNSLRHEIH